MGGGFIGLEMAENLVHLGFDVTLIQMLDHVLAPLDPEIACIVEGYIERHGVRLSPTTGWPDSSRLEGGAIEVQTRSGKMYPGETS